MFFRSYDTVVIVVIFVVVVVVVVVYNFFKVFFPLLQNFLSPKGEHEWTREKNKRIIFNDGTRMSLPE